MDKKRKNINGYIDHLNRKRRLEARLDPSRFDPPFMRLEAKLRGTNRSMSTLNFAADNLADAIKSSWHIEERLGGLGTVWDNHLDQGFSGDLYSKFEQTQKNRGFDLNSIWNSNLKQGFSNTYLSPYERNESKIGLGSTWDMNVKQGFAKALYPQYAEYSHSEQLLKRIRGIIKNIELPDKFYEDFYDGFIEYDNLDQPHEEHDFDHYEVKHQAEEIVTNVLESDESSLRIDHSLKKVESLINKLDLPQLKKDLLLALAVDTILELFKFIQKILICIIVTTSDVSHSNFGTALECYTTFFGEEQTEIAMGNVTSASMDILIRDSHFQEAKVKGYIQKGDGILIRDAHEEWTLVGYNNEKGELSEGWLLTEHLE